jgi:hypothetical protein
MWNPFHAWGSVDNFDMRFMGEFNPLYFLMSILVMAGCPIYVAFVFGVVLYFWLGCLGFYAIARRIFDHYDSFNSFPQHGEITSRQAGVSGGEHSISSPHCGAGQGGGCHPWAVLAYVFLLFSNLGDAVFRQFVVLVIFVPAVWFFVVF